MISQNGNFPPHTARVTLMSIEQTLWLSRFRCSIKALLEAALYRCASTPSAQAIPSRLGALPSGRGGTIMGNVTTRRFPAT